MNHFYEKHISLHLFNKKILSLSIKEEERTYLFNVAKSAVLHKFVDFCLLELDKQHHKQFVKFLKTANTQTINDFLNTNIQNYEQKALKKAKEVEKELLELLN